MSDELKIKGGEKLAIGDGWLVLWESSETWLDFQAYEGISDDDDGALLFDRRRGKLEFERDARKSEPTLKGYVKWDGCCEVDFASTHFCDAQSVDQIGQVLRAIHRLALKIPRVDLDCAGYGDLSHPKDPT